MRESTIKAGKRIGATNTCDSKTDSKRDEHPWMVMDARLVLQPQILEVWWSDSSLLVVAAHG